MPIEVKTYKEYLADEAEASKEYAGSHCFVAGCTNPHRTTNTVTCVSGAGCANSTWTTYEPSCCSAE